MNIRPRNIQKYQGGGTFNLADWIAQNPTYYEWYRGIYPNALVLAGNPLKLNLAHANYSKISSSHHTTDDLQRSAYNNYLYTSPDLYSAREADIINWANRNNIDLNTVSDEDFVNTYNRQAQTIRDAREAPQTYNRTGYTGTNQTFRNMFGSRSQQGTNHPLYNIGYLENIEDIEGTSTWQRRMDRYEKRFLDDTPENQKNRTFYITRPDGRKIKVYKKENGDLGLFDDPSDPNSPKDPNPENPNPENPQNPKPGEPLPINGNPGRVPVGLGDWERKNPLKNINLDRLAPAALNIGRLWNILRTNANVYKHMKKAIFPVLQQSYHTHRQVVGDEATKLGYYTRAAEGQTKAARPFTSDADRQMAYLMEAKRIGDLLRAEGDRADNAEIRRTSDEAMQHAWQNVARDTQVANENVVSIAKAKAAKHQLDAQEASAKGTSIDNWLKDILSNINKRNYLNYAYNNRLKEYDYILGEQEALKNETDAYNAAENAYQENPTRENLSKVNDALINLKRARMLRQRDWYKENPPYLPTWLGKRGGRFTFDHDAELLYKVSRDAVKHFREMSKQTDDSRIKTLPKAVKLKGVPKPSSRKYQYGGQAPFLVYTPLATGGVDGSSVPLSSESSGKSSSGNGKKDESLDVIKDLFKDIVGKGLQSDVNMAYDQISSLLRMTQASGSELDSADLASLYLKQMKIINDLLLLKSAWDDALKRVDRNKGLNELAVDNFGRLVVLNLETKQLERKTLEELNQNPTKYNPLTNNQLLQLRKFGKPFDSELIEIVNNGVGIEKINDYINGLIRGLGDEEYKLEGYSKKEGEDILNGIEVIQEAAEKGLEMAPDGSYKGGYFTKLLEQLAKKAIAYIVSTMPKNMKTILTVHTGSVEEAVKLLVSSKQKYKEVDNMGNAVKNSNGKSGSGQGGDDNLDKIKSNPILAMIQGIGGEDGRYNVVTRDSNTRLSVDSKNYGAIPNIKTDTSVDLMLSDSGLDALTNKYGITFGDLLIDPANLRDIMYSNVGGSVVTLPCKIVNGVKQVNFEIIGLYEDAEKAALKVSSNRLSKEYMTALGKELLARHLDSLVDSNGYPNRNMVTEFLVVEGYTTDKNMKLPKSKYIEEVRDPDSALEERLELALSTDDKKSNYDIDVDDKWGPFEGWSSNRVYRASVFIPLSQNLNSAVFGWGLDSTFTLGQSRELERKNLIESKRAQYNNDTTYN